MLTERSKQLRHEFAMRQYRAMLIKQILDQPTPSKTYTAELISLAAMILVPIIISVAIGFVW